MADVAKALNVDPDCAWVPSSHFVL
jgi:hypothetical protein